MIYPTREEWLQSAVTALRPWFDDAGAHLPAKVQVSIGFPSTGRKSKRIGECWGSASASDGLCHIFITPTLTEIGGEYGFLPVLLHELCHAALPAGSKHGPVFKRLALAVGLTGKMISTVPGAECIARLATLATELGPFPHGALRGQSEHAKPKQSTRLRKCECAECGYTARVTLKWIEISPPLCPTHETPMSVVE